MGDRANEKFCVNCKYHQRTYFWGILFLPIFGWITFLIRLFVDCDSDHICSFDREWDPVTGKLSCSKMQCIWARNSTKCGDTGENFVAASTPLVNVDNEVIMEEVQKRGLLQLLVDYKKGTE